MVKFRKLIIWLCKKFNREELLELIHEINLILKDKYSNIKPRDDFKEKHPNYRNFKVDPLAPLEAVEFSKSAVNLNYKELLNQYLKEHGKPLKPVKHTNKIILSLRPSVVPIATPRIRIFTLMTGKNVHNSNAKSAKIPSQLNLNLKKINPNITAPIVITPSISGNNLLKYLSTSAVIVSVHIAFTNSINSMKMRRNCAQNALRNSKSLINTGNIIINRMS